MILNKIARKIVSLTSPIRLHGGVVSITFDDQWHSAYQNAFPLLESYGFKSTWYICVSHVGNYDQEYAERSMSWDEIRNLRKSNHEIASHTITHCDFDTTDISTIREELRSSKKTLASGLSCPIKSFAYPFTRTGSSAGGPQAALTHYRSARGGEFGFNSLPFRRDNLFACKLYGKKYELEYLKELVDKCVAENKWLIFYTHDVKEDHSDYGCTPAMFEGLLRHLRDTKVKVNTVGDMF